MSSLDHLERPETTPHSLTFHGQRLDLYRLDGLLWLRKDALMQVLRGEREKDRSFYGRHFTPFSTRIVAMPPLADTGGPLAPTRLFSMWGAARLAVLSRSPVAAEFVRWSDEQEARPDAPQGLSSDDWRPIGLP